MALNNERLDDSFTQMDEDLTWIQSLEKESLDNRGSVVVDSIKQYASEVGRYPLLTAQGEQILFTFRDQGGTVQTLRESSAFAATLTTSTKPKMSNALVESRSINDVAYLCNLRLPLSMARMYPTYDFMEKVQHGNIGLLTAVERFEVEQGNKFSTYAFNWIRQRMVRGIQDTGHTIRIPVHIHIAIQKVNKVENQLRQELQTDVAVQNFMSELQSRTGLEASTIQAVFDIRHSSMKDPIPLETVGDSEDERQLLDIIPDPEDPFVGIDEAQSQLDVDIENLMSGLTLGERAVAEKRLFAPNPLKLREIGAMFDVSRERVRQWERAAVQKLGRRASREDGSYIGEVMKSSNTVNSLSVSDQERHLPEPEIVQPIVPHVETPINYFEKNRLLVEKASQDEKIWGTVPNEAKTLLNMTFLCSDDASSSSDRAELQQELAKVLGITDTDVRKTIRHWIEVFENSF